jgi:hypothetical protein
MCARTRSRNRLIRAFSAAERREWTTNDRLTWRGQDGSLDDKVQIDAPDNTNT